MSLKVLFVKYLFDVINVLRFEREIGVSLKKVVDDLLSSDFSDNL